MYLTGDTGTIQATAAPSAALAEAVARSSPELKTALERGLEKMLSADDGDRKEAIFRAAAMIGGDNHKAESINFFKTFPDNHLINHPYKAEIAQGEWTCTVADFRGTMTGPMAMADGTVIQPTNKSFHVDFCTVARWNEQGQIVEENLFYDLMGMLKQIGLMPTQEKKAA